MGTISSSATIDGTLDNDMIDHALISVELVAGGIGLQVNEEFTNNLDRLLWPSSLSMLEWFALGVSSNSSSVPSEWNNLSVLKNVLQVGDGLLQVPAFNSTGDFISVLIVSSEVSNLALGS